MALHLERDGEPVAEVEHACVLARALEHARPLARQPPQEERGVLVPAVLRPEQREHGELEVVGLAMQQRDDAVELPVREAELAMERLFRDLAQEASLAAGVGGAPGSAARSTRRASTSVARCPGAISASCSCCPRSGAPRSSSSRSASTSSSRPWSPSAGWRSGSSCCCRSPRPREIPDVRRLWVSFLVLGTLNNALPFWLLGFAETRIDSGLAGVIQAAAPIFTVLLATWIDPSQRVRGVRLVGVGLGFLGVALLVGVQEGGELVGALAVVGTALCYASRVLYAGRAVRRVPPLQVSIGQLAVGTLLVAPFALLQLPSDAPPRRWSPRSRPSARSARASRTSSTSR